MRIFVILLVVLIAVNFSLSANTDSKKAKKAQNQSKAIIKKLISKILGLNQKLKSKVVAGSNKYVSELTKTGNTVNSAFRPLGNQGQALGGFFKGNVTQLIETFLLLLNPKSLDAILKASMESLKMEFIDPLQLDITNLTKAINNKTSTFNCFESNLKSFQATSENIITQLKPTVEQQGAIVKSNMTAIAHQVEAMRKTIVSALKACKGSESCGVKYVSNLSLFSIRSLMMDLLHSTPATT